MHLMFLNIINLNSGCGIIFYCISLFGDQAVPVHHVQVIFVKGQGHKGLGCDNSVHRCQAV